MRKLTFFVILGLVATPVWAVMETASFVAQPSDTLASGTTVTYMATGGYTMGALDWSGFASTINAGTWGSELRVDVSGPLGAATIQLGSGTTYAPGAAFSGSDVGASFGGAGDPAGLWTFDFYESYDDGFDGVADATWDNISFDFNAGGAPPGLDAMSIGTLVNGSSVTGDTGVGSTDDLSNNGYAPGSWSGADDVWTLNWAGGDLTLDLLFTNALGDIDMFLFDGTDPSLNGIANSMTTSDNEQISMLGLAAGTYYISVDGWAGATNAYTLNVTPEPASLALMVLGGVAALRRRRS